MSDFGNLASFRSINETLGLRNDRRLNERKMRQDQFNKLAEMLYGSREAKERRAWETGEREATQDFTSAETNKAQMWESGEAQLNRAHEVALQSNNLEAQRELQILRQDFERDLFNAKTAAEVEAATTAFQRRLQEISALGAEERTTMGFGHGLDMTKLTAQQQHDIQMIHEKVTAEKEMIDFERSKYENGRYVTQDGATFTWTDPETYQAALIELGKHEDRLTMLTGMRDDPDNPNNPYNIYIKWTDRAKGDLWKQAVDERGMPTWVRNENTIDDVYKAYLAELDVVTTLTDDEKKVMSEAFWEYLVLADKSPPEDSRNIPGNTSVTAYSGPDKGPWDRAVGATGVADALTNAPSTEYLANQSLPGMLTSVILDTFATIFPWTRQGVNNLADTVSGRSPQEPPGGTGVLPVHEFPKDAPTIARSGLQDIYRLPEDTRPGLVVRPRPQPSASQVPGQEAELWEQLKDLSRRSAPVTSVNRGEVTDLTAKAEEYMNRLEEEGEAPEQVIAEIIAFLNRSKSR